MSLGQNTDTTIIGCEQLSVCVRCVCAVCVCVCVCFRGLHTHWLTHQQWVGEVWQGSNEQASQGASQKDQGTAHQRCQGVVQDHLGIAGYTWGAQTVTEENLLEFVTWT